jgi:hypothetical protein
VAVDLTGGPIRKSESSAAVPSPPRAIRRGRAFRLAAPAALAALLVVLATNRGPDWRLVAVSGAGVAVIGSTPVPLNHLDELKRQLRPGVRIRIPEGASLEVASPGHLTIQVTSGADVVLPPPPGRWFGRRVGGEIERGELRVTTGDRFRGATLLVTSPEAKVEARGATLAVIREPIGTGVSVLEGTVAVGEPGGPMVKVEQGTRRFVFNDGREPETEPIRESDAKVLGDLREDAHGRR